MRISPTIYLATIILFALSGHCLYAQKWEFVKEKDGIRLFTSQEKNSSFKSFHGEIDIRGDFEKVSALIGDPTNLDWWGDDVNSIKVLFYEKSKKIQYYLVYDVPWPFADRDLVADVQISEDRTTGTKTIYSRPLPDVVPLHSDLIRVTDYWQRWTLQPMKNGMIHVTLEGFIDPAGNVPAWLYNMVIVDIPLRLLREVKKRA
jgi:hypothetical protein